MRAVVVTKPGTVEIVDLGKPEPGPYQAVVCTEAAYLCNATDGKLVAGHFPGVDAYPLVLGHEDVARSSRAAGAASATTCW
jgi:D-arabinose 1-dehydrogenase-like Zn-dependent alcohol dehydrogenase